MTELIIWIAVLILLLFVCVSFSKRVLLTPQFIYVGCFLPQAVFSIYFVSKWSIDLCFETMLVLVCGTTLFVVASIAFDRLFSRVKISGRVRIRPQQECKSPVIFVERWKLMLLLLFQVLSLAIYIIFGLGSVSGATLLDKISMINDINKFGDIEDRIIFQTWVSWPRVISIAACYVTGYLLLHSVLFKYKQKKLLLILSLIVGVINNLLSGGRIRIVGLLIALLFQAYFIWGDANNWTRKISGRWIVRMIIIGVIILSVFQWSIQFIRRASSENFLDYLGVYIAAPLRNLDAFIRTKNFGNDISNWETMQPFINYLGRTFGITKWIHQYDLPFLTVHGAGVGNVYTAYHAFVHDGGYPAVIIFVLLEAFITQLLYHMVIRRTTRLPSINVSLIVYSYVMYSLVLSFFMERFFTDFVSMTMVRTTICWWLIARFFTTRFRFSKPNRYYVQNIRSVNDSLNL